MDQDLLESRLGGLTREQKLRLYGNLLLVERSRRQGAPADDGRIYDWAKLARPNQLPPDGDWSFWMLLAGRGFGKTRTGAEWIRAQHERIPRMALVAPTAADARDVMVEGESGIMAISPS